MKNFTQVDNSRDILRTLEGLKSRITPFRSRNWTVMTLTFLFIVLGAFSTRAWANKTNQGTITILSGKGKVEIDAYYKYFGSYYHAVDSTRTLNSAFKVSKTKHNTDDGWVKFTATPNTGYTFYGWCEKSDCSDATPDLTNPKEWKAGSWTNLDVVRYTKFTANTYTVKFDKNGGTHGSTASVGATYDQDVTLTTNGFWRAKYVVRYDANGGTCATTVDTAYYSFEGWATTAAGAKAYNDGATLTKPNFVSTQGGEKTLFAKWGSGTTSVILPTPSAAPVYDGNGSYSFAGWYLSTDEATKTVVGIGGGSYTPTANVTLKAKWTLTKQPGFSGADQNMSVGAGYTGFVFSNTTTATPSANPSDKFYYVISNVNVTSANTDGSADPNKVIAVETAGGTTTIRAINKGTAKITFYQQADATNNIAEGNSATYTFTVDKIANTISCNWDGWSKSNIRFDEEISTILSSTNSDGYASLTVTPTAGTNVARYDGANNKVVALCDEGTATWNISQAEDYKYYAATTKTLSVTVAKATPSCYLLEVPGEEGAKLGNEMHEHTWTENNVAGVLSFEVKKGDNSSVGVNVEIQEYVNGGWSKVNDYGGSITTSYTTKTDALSQGATGIKFKSAGSYKNYVQNITITRVNWMKLVNAGGSEISSITLPSRTRTGAASTGTFYIDYSTCADEIKLVSNNSHVKFSANNSTTYTFDVENGTRKTIGLTYTSGDAESIAATITVYTPYDRKTLTVNAQTMSKLTTTLEYKGADSYAVDHANMNATDLFQVRDQNGDLVASPTITLSSSNTSAINTVSSNRAIDFLCGADDVRITASYAGDATYAAASNSGTFYHDIDVIKLADAITWTIGSDAGSKIHVWADSDVPNTIASSDYTSIATYSSNNSDRLSISGSAGSYSLHAGQKGEVTLTVTSVGDCTYNVAEDSKTIVVDPCRHDIVWNQSFKSLMTEEDGTIDQTIDLTAYAVDSNGVATNKSITYTLASTAFASIVDGTKLHITGAGETTITASTADDNKYDRASASLQVRVRRYGEGCDSEITDVTGADSMHKLSGYTNKKGFTYNIAPSDSILVKIGRESRITCGKIYIHGYSKADAKGTETQIRAYDPSELTNDGTDYIIPIDTSYRSIKFQAIGTTGADPGPSGGTQYKWFKNLHIKQASYLLSNRATITNDRVHVYDAINETVVISYSDKPLLNYRITGNKLTLTPSETINNDCGDYGSYTFTVSGTYTTTGVFKDTIYITTTALDTLCIPIKFTVSAGTELYFQTSSGAWDSETKWSNESRVIQDQVPAHDNPVVIKEAVTISTQVEAYKVKIEEGGSVTIAPNGGLSVGAGGISGATTSNFILQAGTEGVTKGKTGYLRISPEYLGSMPYVKVQMYSIGYYDKSSSEENIAAWQYVGTPMDFAGALAKTVFTRSWIYSYLESTDGWVNNRKTLVMQPFVGYGTTQYDSEDGKMIEYPGKLIPNRGLVTIDLEYTDAEHGHNLLANSFAAPIDIMQLRDTDFVNAERAIYIFNTGSKSQASGYSKGGSGDAAGQYRTIAIGTASEMATRFAKDASLPTTIAPMQGFCVNAQAAGAKFKLNYNKLVWNADYSSHAPTALRAPKRNADAAEEEEMPITGSMKMTLEANGLTDNIYLLESERYMTDFEDGYDAHKMESGTLNIFTVENEDKLAIDATNSIIGTRVGVRTGEETAYTITFSYVDGEQEWALYDAETDEMIDITNDNTYTFFAEPNSNITERFMIVESNGAQIPAVTTGNDKVTSDVRAHKFIKDDELFILKNGVLYDVTGARVK